MQIEAHDVVRSPLARRSAPVRELLDGGDLALRPRLDDGLVPAAQHLSVGNRHDEPLKSERLLVLSPGRTAEPRPPLRRYRSG